MKYVYYGMVIGLALSLAMLAHLQTHAYIFITKYGVFIMGNCHCIVK